MIGGKAEAVDNVVTSNTPWIEKYRPKKLSDIAHQEDVVSTLAKTLETANLPHLLFYGPPGTGKTSTILAVARELYGPKLMKKRVLELNASNERGIKVVRDKIKSFASLAVSSRESTPGYPCPPYKIIILDEADSMTKDAQSALRRTMEQYTKVTRFCIICNYVSRIIDPITSRCAKFRYKSLSSEAMISRLETICTAENVRIHPEVMPALVSVSGGDMRKSITLLQTARRLVGPEDSLRAEHINEVAGKIPDDAVDYLLKACKTKSFAQIENATKDIAAEGYPLDQILAQLQPLIADDESMTNIHKSKICIRIAECDLKLVENADEYLQLLDVLSFISTTILEK